MIFHKQDQAPPNSLSDRCDSIDNNDLALTRILFLQQHQAVKKDSNERTDGKSPPVSYPQKFFIKTRKTV
jgi:hypothetical protein